MYTTEYEIAASSVEALERKLKRLQKRTTKLGCSPIGYEFLLASPVRSRYAVEITARQIRPTLVLERGYATN